MTKTQHMHKSHMGSRKVRYKDRAFYLPKKFLRVPTVNNEFLAAAEETTQDGDSYRYIALYNRHFFPEQTPTHSDRITVPNSRRICLPRYLDDFLKPDNEIVVLGVLDRLELWLPNQWKKYTERTSLEAAAKALFASYSS